MYRISYNVQTGAASPSTFNSPYVLCKGPSWPEWTQIDYHIYLSVSYVYVKPIQDRGATTPNVSWLPARPSGFLKFHLGIYLRFVRWVRGEGFQGAL